ncbi:histone acetyltransferase GCN5 [Naviculisporaceae sp. PSN 640]
MDRVKALQTGGGQPKRAAPKQLNSPNGPKRTKKSNEKESASTETASFREPPAAVEERNGEIEFRVVNNDGSTESTIILTRLKDLFRKQIPLMDATYITRVVLDRTHLSLVIVKESKYRGEDRQHVLGGVTWREFRDRKFAEIVFCAISSNLHGKGYGTHLMAHLKDYIRTSGPVMHLLTYADTLAVGYFKKQGFSKDITLDPSVYMGYIKHYQGASLMHCPMLPRIRYLEEARMLHRQKEIVQAKIAPLSNSHVVHQPPAQWANGVVTPIDPMSIPAIRATGWSPEMENLSREPRHGPYFNDLRRFFSEIQDHKQAWPFLQPVNPNEVPGYDTVITEPMDLSTAESKLENDQYATPNDLVKDLKLMFNNCKVFNKKSTVYHKAAVALEKYMWTVIKEDFPEWSEFIEKE